MHNTCVTALMIHGNGHSSQIPEHIRQVRHSVAFWNRNVHVCIFLFQNAALKVQLWLKDIQYFAFYLACVEYVPWNTGLILGLPSQWETSLQSNAVSHWQGANLESALEICTWFCCAFPFLRLCCQFIKDSLDILAIFLHAKLWIMGGGKSIFTVPIH